MALSDRLGLAVSTSSSEALTTYEQGLDLALRWRIDLATAQHLVLYPDSGELVANHHDRAAGDSLVTVDVATGEVRTRTAVDSPAQSVVFGAPGERRDFYYVSLSTVARVTFHDGDS